MISLAHLATRAYPRPGSPVGAQPKRFRGSGPQKAAAVGPASSIRLPIEGQDVLRRRAIAIVAVGRANAVAILGDFSRQPTARQATQRSNRTPTGSCQCCGCVRRPQSAGTAKFFALFQDLPILASSSTSNFLMRAPSSGRRENQAFNSLNFSSGRTGVPHTICPLRTILPGKIPACDPITA